MKAGKIRRKEMVMIAAALILILVLILSLTTRKSNSPNNEGASFVTPQPVVKHPDEVKEHFTELGKIEKSQEAAKSKTVQSEKQAAADLSERGFTAYDITSSYDAEGHWMDETVIGADSDAKHPIYKTMFIPDDETIWIVYDFNGALMAKPYIHPTLPEDELPVYLSETGTLMCYDSYNNTFYELSPDAATARVIRVERIDAETLKNWAYTEEDDNE